MTGTVAWWDVHRGWGFARVESHPDVFLHHAALVDDALDLRPGDLVIFGVRDGTEGKVGVKVRLSPSSPARPT